MKGGRAHRRICTGRVSTAIIGKRAMSLPGNRRNRRRIAFYLRRRMVLSMPAALFDLMVKHRAKRGGWKG